MTKRPVFGKVASSCAALIAVAALVAACGDDDSASVTFVSPSAGESVAGSVAFDLAAAPTDEDRRPTADAHQSRRA